MNVALLAVFYLFASSSNERNGGGNNNKGRQRYDPKRRQKEPKHIEKNVDQQQQQLPPPPVPTDPKGPFPTYFTCRHTYEETLIEEILRTFPKAEASSSYPGLVRVDNIPNNMLINQHHGVYEPVYALQALPECRILKVPESIKGLARAVTDIADFQSVLSKDGLPRGSLRIHALVPGMCKGQKDPILQRRAFLVADAVSHTLQQQYPAARRSTHDKHDNDDDDDDDDDNVRSEWLLQILLLSPDVLAVSLTECLPIPYFPDCRWPNAQYPMGMAQVDMMDVQMPSSAYRKLLEGFACWGKKPSPGDHVVDLGASPGGWTAAVMLLCQSKVIAVDRSPLHPRMMNNLLVKFVQGDAFTYEPDTTIAPVAWMVSDIIAYPERVAALLELWCGKRLAKNMLVTVKFQGSTPSWEALNAAIQVARHYGYYARAKHFFNNKNEVSLLIQGPDKPITTPAAIDTMYNLAWPKKK